jgi:hypothetical protein
MKRLIPLLVAIAMLFAANSYGQIYCEDFEYAAGDTITNHGWVTFGSFGENPIVVVEPGLEHFCYGAIFGNAARLVTTGEDSYIVLPSFLNAGTVYVSFMVKFESAQHGDFFIHLGDSVADNSNKLARVYAKMDGGNIAIGLAKNNEAPVYTPADYLIGDVIVVVLKYEFFTTTNHDDLVSLFVFGPEDCPPVVEPTATLGPLGDGEDDLPNVGKIVLCQGADSHAPVLIIDGICMDRVWDNSALPVEMTSFTSTVTGNGVVLNWSTAYEKNNAGFNVERKLGTGNWIDRGFVKGNGTTEFRHDYSFNDRFMNSGIYQYRLKQLDYNGNIIYHDLGDVIRIGTPADYELYQNFPNPFNPSTIISFALANDGVVTLKIFDNSGREISKILSEFRNAGYYNVDFDASNLSSGVYYYRIESNGFVKTLKMVLMK